MATEGVNITEDAEMAECEGDKVVTMMDVLQEQQEFEEDANAVLGASDDKNCTYAKGYIKRQAIYACLTCCPDVKADPTKRAGVCLACSLMCHENHELVELYTKRNFRCDCGNPKFNSHACQFTPSKPDLNDDNIYNQNFSGLYCICQRPYPDPEATTEDDMIQCVICEDWLHASHLDATVPANDQYSEMICKGCMEKNEFLHDYSNFAVNVESVDVDILYVNVDKSSDDYLCNGDAETLTNGDVETGSEKAAIMPKAQAQAIMSEDKEKCQDQAKEEKENNDGLTVPNEEAKQSPELDKAELTEEKTEERNTVSDEIDREVNIDTDRKEEQESQSIEAKVSSDDAKKSDELAATKTENAEEMVDKVVSKEDNLLSGSEQKEKTTLDTDDKMEIADDEKCANSSEAAIVTEEQNDEQCTNDVKDKDANKTEDQLLDDISALTTDNNREVSKPSVEDVITPTIENATEESKGEEKPAKSLEKDESTIETEKNNDKIEKASIDKPNDDKSASTETNIISETSKIEVSDTSKQKNVEMETTDDKTDSVMDAIDELLKDPAETNKSDSKDNENQPSEELSANKDSTDTSETPNTNEVEMSKCEDKPDNNISEMTDSKEKIDTDVEMTENQRQDEPSPIENNTPIDSESTQTSDIEKIDSISKKEPAADIKIAESELCTDVDNKSLSKDTEPKGNSDSTKETEALVETDNKNKVEDHSTSKNETCEENKISDESDTTNEHKRKLSIELAEETFPKKIKLDHKCVRPRNHRKIYKGATFWPSNFRQKLCTCGECISMYKDLHVLFLTDPEDTVSFYESLGKENIDSGVSQYEKGLQALSSLDRIQQINALTEYNRMRDKLLDFLKSFKDRKEIVKEEDIKAFFAGMKPKREPDGVYFCR